jgi:hypothetical protein
LYGGERTITLPAGSYSVYDVYENRYLEVNGNRFTVRMNDNDAKLFRLMSPGKIAVLAYTNGGHAQLSALGITEVDPGANYTVKVTVDEGYYLAGLRINGVDTEPMDTVSLQNITQSSTVEFIIRQIKTYPGDPVAVTKTDVRWGLIAVLLVSSVFAFALAGAGIEMTGKLVMKKFKKVRR